MRYLATGLVTILLLLPALSVELFRYRGAAKDGTLEYVFEAGEQNSPDAVTKEKAAEIAADFMTTFYHILVGALEAQEFWTMPRSVLADLLLRHDQAVHSGNFTSWSCCQMERLLSRHLNGRPRRAHAVS
jgi:hypothetical protein